MFLEKDLSAPSSALREFVRFVTLNPPLLHRFMLLASDHVRVNWLRLNNTLKVLLRVGIPQGWADAPIICLRATACAVPHRCRECVGWG